MGRWPPTRARMKMRKGTPTMGLARLITQLQGGAGEARRVHPVGVHAWPCSTGQESNHDTTDRQQLGDSNGPLHAPRGGCRPGQQQQQQTIHLVLSMGLLNITWVLTLGRWAPSG